MSLPLSNFPTSTPMSLEPKPFQKGAKLISSELYKVNIICKTLDWDLYSLFNNTNIILIKPTLLVSLLEQGRVLWPLKTKLMSEDTVTRFVSHCTHLSCSLVAHEQRPLRWRHLGCCHPWCHLTCNHPFKWMNGYKQRQSYAIFIRRRLNLAFRLRIAPEHIILFLHRSFTARDRSR